jgi:hypothetical protein
MALDIDGFNDKDVSTGASLDGSLSAFHTPSEVEKIFLSLCGHAMSVSKLRTLPTNS